MDDEKKIELDIECKNCGGTGIYVGTTEKGGAGVICFTCKGTGKQKYSFTYIPFTERKMRSDIKRVYAKGTQFCIAPEVINFDGIGEVDMTKEGVSYQEFLEGKVPKHIEQLGCPMLMDQGACHYIEGFTDRCNEINGGWVGLIPLCKGKSEKSKCWDRFNKAIRVGN